MPSPSTAAPAMTGPPAATGAPGSSRPWIPKLFGLACFLIGLLDIASAIVPRVRESFLHHVAHYIPGALTSAANAATMVVGFLLVMTAHALRRRKQRAWRAVVALLTFGVVFHVVRRAGVASALVSLVMLVGLIIYRREFYAKSDPRSRWRALFVFVGLLVASGALGMVIVSSRPDALVGDPGLGDRFLDVIAGLFGVDGPLEWAPTPYGARSQDLISDLLLGLGLLTALVTVYLALRPEEPAPHLDAVDEERIRDLLVKQGTRDSLGYFALRRDKSVVWSPTGKACIAYRVVSGVMLASGDPIGDPEAWPGAIRVFQRVAEEHAWIPAVMGCSEQGGEIWTREAKLSALELGDEAIVEVAEFTLEGRAMRNVRQMVNRIERSGYVCEVRRIRDVDPEELAQGRRQADRWRGTETERGFSMALGRFGDPADPDCVVATATRDGELRAVLHFVPWGRDGLSLDLMRRDRDAEPGLNELLIVAVLRAAPGLGVKRVSLNFAVFRSALERGERLGAGPVIRAWRGLLLFLSRWFQIESLYRFNAKFRPVWEPRFIVFPQTRDLPRIAIAALEAEAFLVLPDAAMLRRKARRALSRLRPRRPVGASAGPHGFTDGPSAND